MEPLFTPTPTPTPTIATNLRPHIPHAGICGHFPGARNHLCFWWSPCSHSHLHLHTHTPYPPTYVHTSPMQAFVDTFLVLAIIFVSGGALLGMNILLANLSENGTTKRRLDWYGAVRYLVFQPILCCSLSSNAKSSVRYPRKPGS